MKKREAVGRVLLSMKLEECLRTGKPFSFPGDGRDWTVRQSMIVNGVTYPFHLYLYEKSGDGAKGHRYIRIGIDPSLKMNGKKIKNPFKRYPVFALAIIESFQENGDRTLTPVYEFGPVDWLFSVVPDVPT